MPRGQRLSGVPGEHERRVPFTLDDLDRIQVRMGTGTRTLRALSDTQFTAWLRANHARGEIGVVTVAPGQTRIPIEERVRVLNELEASGFYIPDVMGTPGEARGPDAADLARAQRLLQTAGAALQDLEGVVAELGEFDWRVNLRASVAGAIQLVQLMQGAVEQAQRETAAPPAAPPAAG